MHAGSDTTPRLARLLRVLQAHPHGLTTAEIQSWTNSMAPATDCSELRRSGHLIQCTGEGMRNGRRIYRYVYCGKKET